MEAATVEASPRPRSPARPPRRRWTRFLLPTYVVVVLLYTMVPIAVMILYGFNQSPTDRLTFAWNGFTLDWYRRLFEISDLTDALLHSLEIAALSTVIAVALGTPAALALARYRFRGRGLGDVVVLADIAAPSVVVGASLLGFFVYLGVPRGFGTILLAHVAFNVAFVVIVVQARVSDLDESLVEAARDLGASPLVAFWKVTLPLIFPGILAASLLAFALSIDDFIITSFVAGQTLTFPLWVYGAVKVGIPPQVFVMGTLIFTIGILFAIAAVIANRRSPA
ncbi:MAG: ABC transporter permease subunit [Solirubrobacterales bacterium]|nr:ABC transporter permease subunit [Solirubrobacterales bacterium]